ncbi:gamma-aminobutyric acid receptor subunit beta isoform X7 [Venturia canescens]|uniref:gamma-aminobutyric acid receptor subunit beta isoform X7 n=1 Tax=Venturia canescens TaxID=32260 RepID=UPI001C9D1A00|nr:gamma-aminobutyric acid receptor subunit beta isoform X7 [Venturia canescens]
MVEEKALSLLVREGPEAAKEEDQRDHHRRDQLQKQQRQQHQQQRRRGRRRRRRIHQALSHCEQPEQFQHINPHFVRPNLHLRDSSCSTLEKRSNRGLVRYARMRSHAASWSFVLLAATVALVPATHTPPFEHAAGGGSMFGDVNISAILDSFSISYDKRVRPNYGGPPVEVGVTMYVLSISSLSEVKMDFTLDFYFRQFWTDPRLAFKKRTGVETLSVGSEFIKNIWVPDTFFVNEKQSYFHIATTSNEFIRIHHSGSITRSIRLTITASCPMNLQYFPMDRQLCHIEIESFGYTMRDIRYKWNAGLQSVGISREVELPQFRVLGHRQRQTTIHLSTGNYSRLACEIQFVRSMGYYLIQIYIPSGLIVIISWVSFWLNRNATPARVALGVTTVLTMTTLMSSTNAALPKISYVKSIDVYLGTCFVMVFASLLEYATVGYMAKRIQMRKNRFQKIAESMKAARENPGPPGVPGVGDHGDHAPKQTVRFKVHDPKAHSKGGTLENTINGRADEEAPPAPQHLIHPGKDISKLYGITPSDIDKYSRIVFPVCFVCFNLMYWIIYLHISDVVADDLVFLEEAK